MVTVRISENILSISRQMDGQQDPEDWRNAVFCSQGTDGALSGRAGAGYGNRLLWPDAWTGYAG